MKRRIMFFLAIIFSLTVVGCQTEEEPEYNPDDGLDFENVFFDDFSQGVDINNWEIAHTKWGTTNNGVIAENVNYTEDGILVLQANGDLYAGDFQGYNSNEGTRTGAALISNEAFGPGRYEIRMKAMPRFGATTAFWTYYYNHAESLNHEIDIELNVNQSFRTIWTTNWTTLNSYDHRSTDTDIVNNDGEWHTYKFEWRTDPERVDYYVDDILIHTSYHDVPDHASRLWLGMWFPDAWAGVPDFETDYMFVDWVRYTPALNDPYVETAGGQSNFPQHYPSEPIEKPLNNLVSNPSFEGNEEAWRRPQGSQINFVENEGINQSTALFVPKDDIAYQFITGMDETFEITIIANAKLMNDLDAGFILIDAHPLETSLIESFMIMFDSDSDNYVLGDYFTQTLTIQLPPNTRRLEVSLIGSDGDGIYFDDLFINLSKKTPE